MHTLVNYCCYNLSIKINKNYGDSQTWRHNIYTYILYIQYNLQLNMTTSAATFRWNMFLFRFEAHSSVNEKRKNAHTVGNECSIQIGFSESKKKFFLLGIFRLLTKDFQKIYIYFVYLL